MSQKKIKFYNVALADFEGTSSFWVSGEGSDQDQMNPPPWANSDLTTKKVEVPTTTLDKIIGDRYVAFMKIDAQGNDPVVLNGAKRMIREKRIGIIQFEVAPTLAGDRGKKYVEVVEFLAQNNYVCYDCNFEMILRKENGVQFTQHLGISARISQLLEGKFNFKGANHGQWTNFVCVAKSEKIEPRTNK